MLRVVTIVLSVMYLDFSFAGPEKVTRKVFGDAGEVLVQELLQRLGLGGGSQALDELQVHRRWVVLHLLHKLCPNVLS